MTDFHSINQQFIGRCILKKWGILIFLSMLVVGCTSNPVVKPDAVNSLAGPLAGAPKWVLQPDEGGGVAAVGAAPKSLGGMQFQRTEALANGRDELARQINLKVKNMLSSFSQQTGVGDQATFDKVVANVSRQVANETLNGSKQKDIWIATDGTLYILVVLDAEIAKQSIKQSTISSLKNEAAVWQQIQAQKAMDELEAELNKQIQ